VTRSVGAFLLILVALFGLGAACPSFAQAVPSRAPTIALDVRPLPSMENPVVALNPEKATDAYLARISGKARARSDGCIPALNAWNSTSAISPKTSICS